MESFVKEFLAESRDGLDDADRLLIEMNIGDFSSPEAESAAAAALGAIFRTIHTIKGSAGFLGYANIEQLAHRGESLLGALRAAQTPVIDEPLRALLLRFNDGLRARLTSIEHDGDDSLPDLGQLVKELGDFSGSAANLVEMPPEDSLEHPPGELRPSGAMTGAETHALTAAPDSATEAASAGEKDPLTPGSATSIVSQSPLPQSAPISDAATLRVDVSILDHLMNLVGELVLVRNQLIRRHEGNPTIQHLNGVTRDLQAAVMKVRMQSVGSAWGRFPRMIHDLANTCGKDIRLEMSGSGTELDKSLLEAIRDPLTHLVRNAADHGIETPEERLTVGKPAQGVIHVRAHHEGGQVNIEIADDGSGLDYEKIIKRGIALGLVDDDAFIATRDRQSFESRCVELLFHPGFSTAVNVNTISGRGVGMDIVKTNIERVGGTVATTSKRGQGTSFTLRIPLTLAIIPALVVRVQRSRFLIPQEYLVELVRLDERSATAKLEFVHTTPVFRHRDKLLPLVDLAVVLGLGKADRESRHSTVNVAIVDCGGERYGIVVDGIEDSEEIVVKPLDDLIRNVKIYAGATTMGDGAVALILDCDGLARHMNLFDEPKGSSDQLSAAETVHSTTAELAPTMIDKPVEGYQGPIGSGGYPILLCQARDGRGYGFLLSQIFRLERIGSDQLECSGSTRAVQYRGDILPVADLDDVLLGRDSRIDEDRDGIRLVVCTDQERHFGLVVRDIVDVVADPIKILRLGGRPGIQAAGIVRERITEIVDLGEISRRIFIAAGMKLENQQMNHA